jgi:hypothetical protein
MTPNPAPGDDGDRDAENPDIETPVPVNEPNWQDFNPALVTAAMTPETFRILYQNKWHDDLTAYHSHLCECPACAMADGQRTARLKDYFGRHSLW